VITWTDARDGATDIYAQRVDGSGAAQWTANGVAVCSAANAQNDPQIVADNSNGTIVLWNDDRDSGTTGTDIYAQRMDASGSPQWTTDGVAVCTAPYQQVFARMTPDGNGGVVAAWMDTRSDGINYDIYAQHVNAAGTMLWTTNGVALCTVLNGQDFPTVVTDGFSGAIVAWQDFRSSNTWDIYANRVTQGGVIPTPVGDTPAALSLRAGDAYPNPFSTGTALDVSAPDNAGLTVDVFDVAGRRVRTLSLKQTAAGTARISFDGRDDRRRLLPSGVYFMRVHAANETVTRKLVIQR
ncbi:MAG TPA: T9SS type A sorting domain-containing protein, partial [Candidatus Krumholzibacteria bacterium]|nr:T9SS type A sorting domain-containing protein [Candidatus Krumholzibacteria bacterium]